VTYALLLLPEFSLILLGYLICRTTALNRSVWSQVDALVYYLLFPTLLQPVQLKESVQMQRLDLL
jgi:predicted permease